MPNEMNHLFPLSPSPRLFPPKLREAFRHRRPGDRMISVFVWTAGGLVLAACTCSDNSVGGLSASADDAGDLSGRADNAGRIRVADQSSGYVDDTGGGLLAEGADGSQARIEIGALSHEVPSQVNFELAKDEKGNSLNNNADFEITTSTSDGVTTYTLEYKGTVSGDFETGDTLMVLITSTDEKGENPITENYLIYLADVDDLPVFGVSSYSFTLAENTDGSAQAVAVGTVRASDADAGDSTLTYRFVNGEQSSGSFRIDSSTGEITYTGSGEDFEGGTGSLDLTVEAMPASGGLTSTADVTVRLTDVDEAPTAMTLSSSTSSVAEGVTTARKLADISFTDDKLGTNTVTVSEVEVGGKALFEIRSGSADGVSELWLKAGVVLDHETATSHAVTVRPDVTGSGSWPTAQTFTLNVTNVNDVAPEITSGATATIAENAEISADTAVYTAAATPDVTGEVITWSLVGVGGDDDLFGIDAGSGEVTFKEATTPDHETKDEYTFTVRATSDTLTTDQEVTLDVADVDEAPTGISLSSDRYVFSDTVVGTVTVTDPDAGENYTAANITLDGTDKDALAVVSDGSGGIVLSFASGHNAATKPSYAITLKATDPDNNLLTFSQDFTLRIDGLRVADKGTGYVDDDGDGLLAEGADGSQARIEIGALSHGLSSQVNFELVKDADGNLLNDNKDFEISSGKLYYKGENSGDFEAGDTLVVTVTSTDEKGENPVKELYVIYLADVANAAPKIMQESIPVASGSNTGDARGVLVEDMENPLFQDYAEVPHEVI